MFIVFKSILKKIIILLIVINYSHVSAATIEIKDSTDLVENYALYGVATTCVESPLLSTSQKLEMNQIERHYYKVLKSLGAVTITRNIHDSAAEEVFGIHYFKNYKISYDRCSEILKK